MNLTEALEKNASRLFWAFVILHVLCWTIIPSLVQPNAPLDTIEGFVWGREFQWGYYKHPPLQAWLLEAVTYLTGTSGLGYFGLSALCTGIAFWAIYRTGRLFTSKTKALIATLLCEGIVYFNFLTPEFNPNVLQLMTWALCCYAFAHAILHNKLKHWLLLGVFFALGLYAKYAIVLLGVGFGIFVVTQKETRSLLLSYKPYLAFTLCVGLLVPHIQWLVQHDFLPFTYAVSRSEEAKSILDHFVFPLKFTLSQFVDMVSMLALFMLLFNTKAEHSPLSRIKKSLLFLLAFAPLILNFILSLLSGHKPLDMWGMPYLSFIPLWLMVMLKTDCTEKNLKVFTIAWSFVFLLGLSAFYFNLTYAPQFGFKPLRGHFPGAELSQKMHEAWQAKTGTPLTYIISDAWLGGNVAFYAPDIRNRPHVFIDGNSKASPWIDKNDLNEKGALLIWKEGDVLSQSAKDPQTIDISWQTMTKAPPVKLYWAIQMPKNNK